MSEGKSGRRKRGWPPCKIKLRTLDSACGSRNAHHQRAASHKHLDYYLDEFTFRFNRRTSKSSGKLFYRLAQQTMTVAPVPMEQILHPAVKEKSKPQHVAPT